MKFDANRRGANNQGGKREVAIYRPGCGLFPKSPRGELEDNMSSSTSNLNAASGSNERRNQDLSNDGTQNGPNHGPHNQSRSGNGRRSGHSGKGRSGRSEKPEGRSNRDNKDIPISKLSERLAAVSLRRDVNQQGHSSDASQSENINSSKAAQINEGVKKVRKPEQAIYVPKPIAQSMANKEAANNKLSNHYREDNWTDDDSASYCAEDDSKTGNSQGSREGRRKKPKRKKKPRRGENSEKSEDGSTLDSKPTQDPTSRGGSQVGSRNDSSGRQIVSSGNRNDPSRPGNRTIQDVRPDNQVRGGHRGGLDNKSETSTGRQTQESVNSRLTHWSSHDGRSDPFKRPAPVPNSMSKSMIDHRKPGHYEEERHKLDDASLTQSWHADTQSGRNVRLGSEPRAVPPGNSNYDNSRSRDTRSVEPTSWNADKVQAKPPSGRRGSGRDISYSSGNNNKSQSKMKEADVPPRFRKKMAENGVKEPHSVHGYGKDTSNSHLPLNVKEPHSVHGYGKDTSNSHLPLDKGSSKYIGTTSEEMWDGSTVTFQGSHSSSNSRPMSNSHSGQYHSLPSMSLPPTPVYNHPPQSLPSGQPHDLWSNTLPGTKTRGRGRLRPEEVEMERAAAAKRFPPPGRLDSHSMSSSVESLTQGFIQPASRSDRGYDRNNKQPLISAASLSASNSTGHLQIYSSSSQALPSAGPLCR